MPSNIRYVTNLPADDIERIVSMVEHQGVLYVATGRNVYRLQNDSLVPLKFEVLPAEPING